MGLASPNRGNGTATLHMTQHHARSRGKMTDPLQRLEHVAGTIARRSEWEQANRVGLLWVHAFIGVTAGLQMLFYGSAANIEDIFGVWTRLAMGSVGLIGGIILIRGIRRRPRGIASEAIGLALLGVWDLAMTLGLLIARLQTDDFSPRWIFSPLPAPGTYVLPYPISVYAGLFALICVHLWTLKRMRKGR